MSEHFHLLANMEQRNTNTKQFKWFDQIKVWFNSLFIIQHDECENNIINVSVSMIVII